MYKFSNHSEVDFENHDGCENDEENEKLVCNSTHVEPSQFEKSKNYESLPKIDHVTFNELVEKVYKPKIPYPKRLIAEKPHSDFLNQPIELNMIQELSMT